MAFRKVQRRIRDEAGNVVGGTNFEVRVYSAFSAGTLAALKLDLAGADARPNPGYPNSGWQCKLTTQLLGTDATAIVDSTAGIQVGDAFPIVDGLFFHYLVVKAVPDATHITLEQTSNAAGSPTGNHTYPVGTVLGDPAMLGHWQGYVSDVQDYDLTVKNVAQGKESNPDQLFTTAVLSVISFQDEGVSTGLNRGTLNFIGGGIAAADDAGNSRVNVTHTDNQTIITTAAEASFTNERVLGTTVILRGVIGSRPAAGTAGYLYASSDETPKSLYRDNGSSWDQIATVGGSIDLQTFTGNGTWNKPAAAKLVIVVTIGGGGGGAGCSTTFPGGGGGGGGYNIGYFDATAFGATENVVVGAAGAAGAAGANNGGAGGTSTFGTTVVLQAFGGGGGSNPNAVYPSGGGGGGWTAAGAVGGSGVGGAGGGPHIYTITTAGDGGFGEGAQGGARNTGSGAVIVAHSSWSGGGGGGGECTAANDNPGGSSMLGGGGGGGGADGANAAGSGGKNNSLTIGGGGAGGTGTGGNGTAGTSRSLTGRAGDGGGGGGSGVTGGIGGAGGVPGGGGGGAGKGTTNTVAGGAGGRGEVLVYSIS